MSIINYIRNKIPQNIKRIILIPKSFFHRFTCFSKRRNTIDSCIIGNGIPKNGTYFLNKIIEYLDKWHNLNIHISHHAYGLASEGKYRKLTKCLGEVSIRKIRNGQFVGAHLPWSKKLEKVIGNPTSNRRIKHILIYRDIRDSFISWAQHVTYSKPFRESRPEQKIQQDFMIQNFSNDEDRLIYMLKEKSKKEYLDYISSYKKWLNSPFCLALKFEDLCTDFIELKKNKLGKTLKKLLEYLEVNISDINLKEFYESVWNKGYTASGIENKIGKYKKVFKKEHYELLDFTHFRKVLSEFGYRW